MSAYASLNRSVSGRPCSVKSDGYFCILWPSVRIIRSCGSCHSFWKCCVELRRHLLLLERLHLIAARWNIASTIICSLYNRSGFLIWSFLPCCLSSFVDVVISVVCGSDSVFVFRVTSNFWYMLINGFPYSFWLVRNFVLSCSSYWERPTNPPITIRLLVHYFYPVLIKPH